MKYALSFIELHNQLFMQGTNLGMKINAAQRGVKLWHDDERQLVWIYFKNKLSYIPLASIASADLIDTPEDILALYKPKVDEIGLEVPTNVVRKRGRPSASELEAETVSVSATEAKEHRDRVRAASANSNRATPLSAQNDQLIQEARMQAAGLKNHVPTAQVQTAQQVGAMTSVAGKPKPISHAQLKAESDKK